jgi:hypothetical protein
MRQSLWVDWSLERPVLTVNHLPTGRGSARDRYYVADLRFMSAEEQEALAKSYSLTAIGPFLALDRESAPGQLNGFSIAREAPGAFASYWVSGSHDLRSVVPDPFMTWELKDRFGLSPNPPPTIEPETPEQLRVMHNIAVSSGDSAAAAKLLEALLAGADTTHAVDFDDGDSLLGIRLERGASLVLSVYFRAAAPDPSEPVLTLRSLVERAPAASLVARDEVLAEVGMPFAIPARRWKAGYVYASITEVIGRIGAERWYGTFRAAHAAGGSESPVFDLLRLE